MVHKRLLRGVIGVVFGTIMIEAALPNARAAAVVAPPRDAVRAGGALILARADCPVTGTIAAGKPENGEALYNKKCAKCHGADGDGNGKAARLLDKKPTAFNTQAAWDKTSLTVKFQSTKCGGEAVGQDAAMPDYPEFSDQQIWDMLAYAQTFKTRTGKGLGP